LANDPVLITGGTGFVGRALAARLRQDGRPFRALGSADGDIADPGTLASLRDARFSSVIHLAARSYVPDSWREPEAFMRTNVQGTRNVLELCRATRAPLVFASSYVYGNSPIQPIGEDVPPAPANPYARSKVEAEQACRFYSDRHGVNVSILRPFNVYGPGQDERFLVPSIVRQVRKGGAIEVQDISPRRDWVFVDDLVAALVAAAQRRGPCSVYNIGSGASTSVGDLVARIQALAGTTLPVRVTGAPRENEIADTVADISKARRELGWAPSVSLDEGLRRCLENMEKR
jgi:nucleoside-diphosphate-sugar epimerase